VFALVAVCSLSVRIYYNRHVNRVVRCESLKREGFIMVIGEQVE